MFDERELAKTWKLHTEHKYQLINKYAFILGTLLKC